MNEKGMVYKESAVRWKEMTPLLITIFTLAVTIPLGALWLHDRQPHVGAATKSEFAYFRTDVSGDLKRIEEKIDSLKDQLLLNSNSNGNGNGNGRH